VGVAKNGRPNFQSLLLWDFSDIFFSNFRPRFRAGSQHKKRFQNVSEKIAEKLLPESQYLRLDICRMSRNNPSVFPSTTQKGSSHAQQTV
jgi:hypothetical protein